MFEFSDHKLSLTTITPTPLTLKLSHPILFILCNTSTHIALSYPKIKKPSNIVIHNYMENGGYAYTVKSARYFINTIRDNSKLVYSFHPSIDTIEKMLEIIIPSYKYQLLKLNPYGLNTVVKDLESRGLDYYKLIDKPVPLILKLFIKQ